jgi:hypothetical protein
MKVVNEFLRHDLDRAHGIRLIEEGNLSSALRMD